MSIQPRLNLAEALLATKDENPSHADALSVLNRSYGLRDQQAAEAEAHHKQFFSLINLRAANKVYQASGGQGQFIKAIRKLADDGGTDDQKVLLIAVLAHSYATQLGLDPAKFSVAFFKGNPALLGLQSEGKVAVNIDSAAWRNKFAQVVNTIAHETYHAYDEQRATWYAEGKLKEGDAGYLLGKAAYINSQSYDSSKGDAASHRKYEQGHLEVGANLVGNRFGHTAETAQPKVVAGILWTAGVREFTLPRGAANDDDPNQPRPPGPLAHRQISPPEYRFAT